MQSKRVYIKGLLEQPHRLWLSWVFDNIDTQYHSTAAQMQERFAGRLAKLDLFVF